MDPPGGVYPTTPGSTKSALEAWDAERRAKPVAVSWHPLQRATSHADRDLPVPVGDLSEDHGEHGPSPQGRPFPRRPARSTDRAGRAHRSLRGEIDDHQISVIAGFETPFSGETQRAGRGLGRPPDDVVQGAPA